MARWQLLLLGLALVALTFARHERGTWLWDVRGALLLRDELVQLNGG